MVTPGVSWVGGQVQKINKIAARAKQALVTLEKKQASVPHAPSSPIPRTPQDTSAPPSPNMGVPFGQDPQHPKAHKAEPSSPKPPYVSPKSPHTTTRLECGPPQSPHVSSPKSPYVLATLCPGPAFPPLPSLADIKTEWVRRRLGSSHALWACCSMRSRRLAACTLDVLSHAL